MSLCVLVYRESASSSPVLVVVLAGADKGIRSNSLSPGPIYIEGGAWQGIKENYFDLYERDCLAHPMERLGTAEEVANVAVFYL